MRLGAAGGPIAEEAAGGGVADDGDGVGERLGEEEGDVGGGGLAVEGGGAAVDVTTRWA